MKLDGLGEDGYALPPAKTPRVPFEHPANLPLPSDRFPKLTAFPVDAIVIKSIVLIRPGEVLYPPPKTPLVDEERLPIATPNEVKSPKSNAFPNVDIDTYCITFILDDAGAEYPPPHNPRVDEEQDVVSCAVFDNKSPKSIAFPSDAIVI